MAVDFYKTFSDWNACVRSGLEPEIKRQLKLFPADDLLVIVPIEVTRPLPRTTYGIQYKIVLTDWCLKLARAQTTGKTFSFYVEDVFFHYWIVPYCIPANNLVDKEGHFNSKLIATLGAVCGVRHSMTIAYHHQANEQIRRYKSTIATRLWHRVAEKQKD